MSGGQHREQARATFLWSAPAGLQRKIQTGSFAEA
jgi:hypothetical protein